MTKKYHPYPCKNGKHKYYIITKSGKTIKFGAVGYIDFTAHKMSSANNYILIGPRIMDFGLNQVMYGWFLE